MPRPAPIDGCRRRMSRISYLPSRTVYRYSLRTMYDDLVQHTTVQHTTQGPTATADTTGHATSTHTTMAPATKGRVVRTGGVVADNLGKRFGDLWALRGLDLSVNPGTVLGLLGHNGAG